MLRLYTAVAVCVCDSTARFVKLNHTKFAKARVGYQLSVIGIKSTNVF
jgi:hypothetical protein